MRSFDRIFLRLHAILEASVGQMINLDAFVLLSQWFSPYLYTIQFPQHYQAISAEHQPAEIIGGYSSIEYTVQV